MNIDSLTFLYLFLPLALLIFYLTPKKFKTAVLALISTSFVAFSNPENAIFFVFDILLQFGISEAIFKNSEKPKTKKEQKKNKSDEICQNGLTSLSNCGTL